MSEAAGSQQPVPSTYNILFVCTGNTCRSPMAEALARREIERRGWSHVQVRSAGVAADAGRPANEYAIAAVREVGLDLSGHEATLLDPDVAEWADIILTMGTSHLGVLTELGVGHKAALLGDFVAGAEGGGAPVSDPFGGDLVEYRTTRAELEELVRSVMDRVAQIVQP